MYKHKVEINHASYLRLILGKGYHFVGTHPIPSVSRPTQQIQVTTMGSNPNPKINSRERAEYQMIRIQCETKSMPTLQGTKKFEISYQPNTN